MFNSKLNVGVYGLAVLPIDYLSRLGDPLEQTGAEQRVDPVYRDVFCVGIRAYQLLTYLKLVREHYGRGVASQVSSYQQRLLESEPGGYSTLYTLDLVNDALDSGTVAADTEQGRIDIPIEMNVALSLLLGVASSPHCVSHPDQRHAEIGSIDLDIDWRLSNCLARARDEMLKVFTPLLACIDSGVPVDYAQSYLRDKRVAN